MIYKGLPNLVLNPFYLSTSSLYTLPPCSPECYRSPRAFALCLNILMAKSLTSFKILLTSHHLDVAYFTTLFKISTSTSFLALLVPLFLFFFFFLWNFLPPRILYILYILFICVHICYIYIILVYIIYININSKSEMFFLTNLFQVTSVEPGKYLLNGCLNDRPNE